MCALAADTEYQFPPQCRYRTHCHVYLLHYYIHSTIGTLDKRPVRGACLTLRGIGSLWKCNHMLGDCFSIIQEWTWWIGAGKRNVSDVSFIAGLFSSHALFHCVRRLIEVLLKTAMILPSHQWGFVKADTAYNLLSGWVNPAVCAFLRTLCNRLIQKT